MAKATVHYRPSHVMELLHTSDLLSSLPYSERYSRPVAPFVLSGTLLEAWLLDITVASTVTEIALAEDSVMMLGRT